MGRKKKRRGRDRALEGGGGTGVDTIDFALDDTTPSTAPAPRPAPAAAAEPEPQPAPAASPPVDPGPVVQTLGELLQQAREARGLCIEEASARTRISAAMLQNLESDRFGEFAADAYVKGFLRNYGNFLGLDVAMLLRRYEAISGRVPAREPELLQVEQPSPRRLRRQHGRAWVAVVACAAAATLCWVFWSRGATRLGLRPTPGLEQIESELQETTTVVPPRPPDALSANDRADIQQKLADGNTALPPPAAVAPAVSPTGRVPAAAAKSLPARGRRNAKPTPPPERPEPQRPRPAERGPIEDLVPPTPR